MFTCLDATLWLFRNQTAPSEETTFPKLHERTQERKKEHRASSEDSGWWFKKRLEDLERAPRSEIVRVHLETTEQKLAMRDFLGEVASSLLSISTMLMNNAS